MTRKGHHEIVICRFVISNDFFFHLTWKFFVNTPIWTKATFYFTQYLFCKHTQENLLKLFKIKRMVYTRLCSKKKIMSKDTETVHLCTKENMLTHTHLTSIWQLMRFAFEQNCLYFLETWAVMGPFIVYSRTFLIKTRLPATTGIIYIPTGFIFLHFQFNTW